MKSEGQIHRKASAFILFALFCILFSAQNGQANPLPHVKEWFALGSGCKAKHDLPGDVSLSVRVDKSQHNSMVLTFHLPRYELDGRKPINPKNATFARECALRAALEIPPGKRIRSLRTNVPFVVSKGIGAKIQLAAQAHLGNVVVDSKTVTEDSSKVLANQAHTVGLFASAQSSLVVSDASFPPQTCGAGKLVGLDLSMTNWRDSFVPQVVATLSPTSQVSLQVELEPCT